MKVATHDAADTLPVEQAVREIQQDRKGLSRLARAGAARA